MIMMTGMIRTQRRTGLSSVNTGRHQPSTATTAYTNTSDTKTGTVIERQSTVTLVGAAYPTCRPAVSSLPSPCKIAR